MRGLTDRYDWAAYYEAAYEKERKKNIILAGKIADAERRQADLNDNLNRIYANPFWKAMISFYRSVKDRKRRYIDEDSSSKTDPRYLRYKEEVLQQKYLYLEWRYEQNNSSHDNITNVTEWRAVKVPESDIMLLTYGKGIIDGAAFEKVKSCFNENKSCRIAYADEDFYWEDLSHRMRPWYKPCYSPDTMLAFNYWGHLVAAKADILSEVLSGEEMKNIKGWVKQSARFYDLCLRLEEAVQRRCMLDGTSLQESICHIDDILYHLAYEPSEDARRNIEECADPGDVMWTVGHCLIGELENSRYLTGAGIEYVPVREAALARRGIKGSLVNGQEPDLYHIIYDTSISGSERCARTESENRPIPPHHAVSVVIPSKDHPDVLERCLKSFRDRTDYPYYELIVVDNGSGGDNRSKMEALQKEYGFTYLYEEMPFNFSKMCNMGIERATGDLILLMNDDVEVIEHSWLRRMAGQALQPHTGAVGAKLWYAESQNIQHVGITNMKIGPAHKLTTYPDDKDYYYGRNRIVYDMIGVTAACLMVSREKYREVGGLDEALAVAFNDVDFCFKLIEAGYYNVQRNDVVLYHHESLSRGLDFQDEAKWKRLLRETETLFTKHPHMKGWDIFYNSALTDSLFDYRGNYKFLHEEPLRTVPVEPVPKEVIRKAGTKRLRLGVENAEIQKRFRPEDHDIVLVTGWCFVSGADNVFCDKQVLLRHVGGGDYAGVPVDWYRKDVVDVFPMERNIEMAGFALRVLKEDLPPGTYRIGMMCTNKQGDRHLAWSDKTCEV